MTKSNKSISQSRLLTFFIMVLGLLVYSCSDPSITGTLNENQAPSTRLTINEVNRSGADRLSSQISISWWGDDPDGYIVGYEYAFNNDTTANDWSFTQQTDSIFVLPLTGADTADVVFRIRAVDNDSLRDPIGANVTFPIRNSTPEIQFVGSEIPSDTTYSIFNFGWLVEDIDGEANIDRVEIQLNQTGNWQQIDIQENFMIVDIQDDQGATANGDIYFGLNFRSSGLQLSNLNIEGDNELAIRVFDKAGAESEIDTVRWFIKKQNSRILVLHDYAGSGFETVAASHFSSIEAAGITNYDVLTINDGTLTPGLKVTRSAALPRITEPTLVRMINKWDFIYFFSSDLDRNITYLQEMTTDFLSEGGKIFANVPMKSLESTDPLFSFLPVQRFASLPDSVDTDNDGVFDAPSNATNFRLPVNTYATSSETAWDSIRITRTITGLAPIEPAAGAISLFTADFQYQVPSFPRPRNVDYIGTETICVKSAENNIIYLSVDFSDLEVDGSTHLGSILSRLLIDELGFSSN